jgi:hypothetical protein
MNNCLLESPNIWLFITIETEDFTYTQTYLTNTINSIDLYTLLSAALISNQKADK